MENQPMETLAGTAPLPTMKTQLGGIGFMLVMTVCFSTLDASAKFVTTELPLWMVMWGRYFFHFLFIAVFFLRGTPGKILKTRNIKLQVLRSISDFLCRDNLLGRFDVPAAGRLHGDGVHIASLGDRAFGTVSG